MWRRVAVLVGMDHPDAEVGGEVALRAEVAGGAQGERGQAEVWAADMDLQRVAEASTMAER